MERKVGFACSFYLLVRLHELINSLSKKLEKGVFIPLPLAVAMNLRSAVLTP